MTRNFKTAIRLASSAGAILLTAGMAQAGIGDELAKLLPTDGTGAHKRFGDSVATSGTTMIVGAPTADDNGSVSGAAYLYDTVSGLQIAKLLPSDGAAGDRFGRSVAILGTTAIIGADGNVTNGTRGGSAYLFDTVTGLQIGKLAANDAELLDLFGASVSISGTTAIIGAPSEDDLGASAGAAYLFDTVTGLQIAKLLASDGASGDLFGASVSISGSTAIVSAESHTGIATKSGAAYLFDAVTGLQIAKLEASDGATFDFFGNSVSISGTTAIVGSKRDDDNGASSGSAYLFDTVTGLQIGKLLPNDGAAGDGFGGSVSISGTSAAVGAITASINGPNSGAAYLFDTVTGLQLAKMLPSDGGAGKWFGYSISLSGMNVVVGSPTDSVSGPGSAYQFQARSLVSNSVSISLGTGGSQALSLGGGLSRAGWFYVVLGSISGTTPGIDFGGGVVLPLNLDAYTQLTLFKPSLGAFGAFRGMLDGAGDAAATFTLPASMDPSLLGLTFSHAYLASAVFGTPEFASNAVSVMLTM